MLTTWSPADIEMRAQSCYKNVGEVFVLKLQALHDTEVIRKLAGPLSRMTDRNDFQI